MANDILQRTDPDTTVKQVVFCDTGGDFSPTAANDLRDGTAGNRQDVQFASASLADGSARQSTKADLGSLMAPEYMVRAAIEFAATPTAGDVVEVYWGASESSTAANGNPANLSGTDSAYTGYSSDLAASVKQLILIGLFVCTARATTTVQVAEIGKFRPPTRYGILVLKNEGGAAFHSDDVETHVVLDPIIPQVQ